MAEEIKVGDLVEYRKGHFIHSPAMIGIRARVIAINYNAATLDFKLTATSPKYKAYLENLVVVKPTIKWRL